MRQRLSAGRELLDVSCTARRAAQTAANLVDFMLPTRPYRQWVFVLPFDLHVRVAHDAPLESAILGVFLEELGALHVLALDGVYVRRGDAAPLEFARAPVPTVEQLETLLRRVATRVRALVGRHPERLPAEALSLMLRLVGAETAAPSSPKLLATHDGFNLHAGPAFEAHERRAIERWCCYALRRSVALPRSRFMRETNVAVVESGLEDGLPSRLGNISNVASVSTAGAPATA